MSKTKCQNPAPRCSYVKFCPNSFITSILKPMKENGSGNRLVENFPANQYGLLGIWTCHILTSDNEAVSITAFQPDVRGFESSHRRSNSLSSPLLAAEAPHPTPSIRLECNSSETHIQEGDKSHLNMPSCCSYRWLKDLNPKISIACPLSIMLHRHFISSQSGPQKLVYIQSSLKFDRLQSEHQRQMVINDE